VVLLRVFAGFIPLLVYSLYKGTLKREHIGSTHHFVVMSFLATSIYFFGFVKGTELLYSGVAGAISGSIPLFSFFAAVVFLEEESFSKEKFLGCLVALVGITLIAKPFSGTMDSELLLGISWMALGSLSLGLSFVYAKKYITPLNMENSALVTYQLGIAAVFLLVVTDLEGVGKLSSSAFALTATVVGLGVIGTGVAYVIYYYLVDSLGAVKAASVTYLPPVVALVIAVLIVDEPLAVSDYAGAALIFSGVYVLNKYNKQKQSDA
jgi:drug/metabolite transporter (DMT)-like permease